MNSTSQPVLVTGATGFVAGWLVKRLLDNGYTVHAAVRDPSDTEKLRYLDQIAAAAPGSIRYFKSDLMADGTYADGMQDCSVVFHTASPFKLGVNDPQKQLIEPALLGTRNILLQANKTDSVKRVVVTSSCAAIYGDNADMQETKGGKFTEDNWNETSSLEHQPYSYSKTLAEREAWKIANDQDRWDLVTINPSFVLGPAINPFASSESFTIFKQFGDGTAKIGVPDLAIAAVDVRDVADAHMAAAFSPAASGRYITSGCDTSFLDMAVALREHFGDSYPFPRRILPKGMVWLMGPLFNKALTRKIVSKNVGMPLVIDNSKSISELEISYRPMETSVIDMFQQLLDKVPA
jgi:nucleoside-diphosphate-sugar epimerase